MSLLTTSQLTFCDLRDSYSVHVDTECIGLVCDNSGVVTKDKSVTINYRVFAGSSLVATSCEVSELPSGVTLVDNSQSSNSNDGSITISIEKGATLNNDVTSSMKLTFITLDSEQFSFEKYITFVKSMTGADGTDAVSFQIYSVDGFEFSSSLTSITLKTVAIQGGNTIASGATYQWFWWNSGSTLDDKYEVISNATSSMLTINDTDLYAFAGIKCMMTYDGINYEDYVSLTKKVDVYTAIAKFFNGSNVITSDSDYIIVYVELYKNNTPEEQILSNKIYISNQNVVQDDVITTDIDDTYEDNSLMYFVCKQTSNDELEYDVVLGRYVSGVWKVVETNYIYNNDFFLHTTSNVLFIPKEKIPRSLSINFEVCNENTIVARTNTIVFDLNDPMVSADAPTNPKVGQLWLDTSVSPSVLKMWDGNQWVNSGYQNGGAIYTSKPTKYSKGDLWILSDNEVCGKYGPGSMLKAIESSTSFDESHWVDAMAENTEVLNNVKQYFLFNKDTGLRIGQQDEKFYVNINATEMGFYDNSDSANPDQKVVSIGNKSAKIKNIIVEDSAEFNCSTTFNNQININGKDSNNTEVNFVWQIESNGSLSLAIGM